MKQLLIIPDHNRLSEYDTLAATYSLGYEYNDFYKPNILDDNAELQIRIDTYKNDSMPPYRTLHGAFFDIVPFSIDQKIQQIADLRIRQSLNTARALSASAVVFHTNYNPYLNHPDYVHDWITKNIQYWQAILCDYPDIHIFLENMFDTTPDLLLELSQRLCEYQNYGVCLDYSHATLSQVPAYEWAKTLSKYIRHIHLNDNDLKRDLHLAWGNGQINRQEFYEAYMQYTPNIPIVIETNTIENIQHSLNTLKSDKFID